jgi:mRNA interferase RelE/StbE
MTYQVGLPSNARKDLDAIPDKFAEQILQKIKALSQNPRPQNCIKLTGVDAYRIKSGNYRVIYEINDQSRTVNVISIKDRKDVYKKR